MKVKLMRIATSLFMSSISLGVLTSSLACKSNQANSDLQSSHLQDIDNLQEVVKGLKWGKELNVTSLEGLERLVKDQKNIVIPIGNSGGLYTSKAGENAKKVLARLPKGAWILDFNTEAKELDKGSGVVLPDINSLAAEVAVKDQMYGMTTSKALDSEYKPNILKAFADEVDPRPVAVSLVDNWDTGFHGKLADWATRKRNIDFNVVIIGGGQISETQGQSWVDVLNDSNIVLTLEIASEAGIQKKNYNAAARLLNTNYSKLKSLFSKKRLMLTREGEILKRFPSENEVKELIPAVPAK